MFSERVNLRNLDSQGRVKSHEVRILDVMLLDGFPLPPTGAAQ